MEYAACFTADSDGFFKRSLIENCVVNDSNPIVINTKPIIFDPITTGNSSFEYVYGIDPASEQDNFSIVVLEIHPDHSRIVYCWTTNRSNFKERQKTGLVKEYDFYGFCARKIRNLMKTFPCTRIGMDAQGGGVAIEEALHDPSKIEQGENPILFKNGEQMRDWIYVLDNCRAVDLVRRIGLVGEIYNIPGYKEIRNIDLVKAILKVLDKPEDLIEFVEDRKGHDLRYSMDGSKISKLGFSYATSFEESLLQTIEWYQLNPKFSNLQLS
jgi:hypothetical protein